MSFVATGFDARPQHEIWSQPDVLACRWDEDRYGLEYDLTLFNVVSVSDFSMGAMENKSLNIFNSRLVLASPETATDGDFSRIQGVIGHEYFHNWTGTDSFLRNPPCCSGLLMTHGRVL